MIESTIQESKRARRRRERLRAAFLEGAEEGMKELRLGRGLTPEERAEAEALADGLYGEPASAAAS